MRALHRRSCQFLAIGCVLATPLASGAQSLNVDLGTARPAPAPTQGAGADQPGVWNNLGLGSASVVGLDGSPTGVTVDVDAALANGNATPLLSEAEEIGDDFVWSNDGSGWSIDISGLLPGRYEVYVYRGDSPPVPTGEMNVGGVDVPELDHAGGTSPYTFVEGESYAVVELDVTGSFQISGSGGGNTGLAAFQLVSLPEPAGAGAALAGLALLGLRRRANSQQR